MHTQMTTKYCILVVEDETSIRETLEDILLAKEYEVISLDNAEDAYLHLLNHPKDIDLVLSDVMLPGRSGLDMLESLRGKPEFDLTPIILLTAKVEEEDVRRGIRTGADDYIRKPFKTQHLYEAIHTQLERYQKLRATQNKILDTVNVQDDLLESIAVINSHWVRAPLTNIFAALDMADEQGKELTGDDRRYMRSQLNALDEMLKAVAARVNGHRSGDSFRFRDLKLPLENTRVFAVDDDSMQLTLLKFLFRKHLPEAILRTFSDPEEALTAILDEDSRPHLIISDINMGDISGFDLIDRLQEADVVLPFFILTSSMHAADIERAMQYKNVYQFLHKPIDGHKLRQIFQPSSQRSGSMQAWMSANP